MVAHLDISIGELYSLQLPDSDAPILADFAKEMRDGRFMFRREGTDREIYVEVDDFERMRSDGSAKRIRLDGEGRVLEEQDINPLTVLDPDDLNITGKERRARLLQQDRLVRARTLRFYVQRYDAELTVGRGRMAIERFIKRHLPDAIDKGFTWKPSPSSVLRAADECGSPGDRKLTHFFQSRRGLDREKRWPQDVVAAANRAIEMYWDDQSVSIGDALYQFRAESASIAAEHSLPLKMLETVADGEGPTIPASSEEGTIVSTYPIPSDETIRLWIHQSADWWHWSQRYGKTNANRRFKGRGKSIEATRPLEFVMFDHTKLDVWSVVMDDAGQPMLVARAYLTLAIDVYSRMILGAVIGYEPPSIHSVSDCLKQVVRRKDYLLDTYGYLKGASDGWGRPFTIIVDNGKEFVSPSFQSACEAAGIDVEWAPIKMPTFKAYVERAFGTLNTILWHKLPGGLPLTPQQRQQLELEKEAEAVFTKHQLERAMWNAIVNLYHLETNTGLGMAPALKWRRGIAEHKRATVDSVEMIDRFLGKGKNCQLSAEGVFVEGHQFHHKDVTTALMGKLVRDGKERQQRQGTGSSRTVTVRVSWNPGDASQVQVWNPHSRSFTALPNVDKTFAAGISFHAAKLIKEFAKAENMKFHSDEDKAKARVAHRKFLQEILPGLKAPDRQRTARTMDPRTELMPGDTVQMKAVDRRRDDVDGGDENNIQHDTAAYRAEHPLGIKTGKSFGGEAGKEKAAQTRERKRQDKQVAQVSKPPVAPRLPGEGAQDPSVDADAIAARVKARLEAKKKKGDV